MNKHLPRRYLVPQNQNQNRNTFMKKHRIALVAGDGSAPEMMAVACEVAQAAARKYGHSLEFIPTPMGWNVYEEHGDTLPKSSLEKAIEIGTIFYGGVGDPKFDDTIGVEKPEMKPEARCLLPLRSQMGLLLNFRPMIYYKKLDHLANVKAERIPAEGIKQIWIRFLLEDSYFGNSEFLKSTRGKDVRRIGVKLKSEITGNEELVTDISFYRKATIEKYIRAAFREAQALGLPLISIDKANVMSRYDFWRKIVTRIGKEEFPDITLTHQLVDSANALLFTPAKLHGVIACGNEHGDILSDGAAGALGSMGMMCSSAINPDTGAAMFESGAGTAPDLMGQDKANPLGRILTSAMMLRHLGIVEGANDIEKTVNNVLMYGYRTRDLASETDSNITLVGTYGMGKAVLKHLGCA
jgi:3-isopropylmalate dehydrogenase